MSIGIFGAVNDIKRLLLTIPDGMYRWLDREAKKRGVSVQNRIRAVLDNKSGKTGFAPIFDRKDQSEVWDQVEEIAKNFYDLNATERQRLNVIDPTDEVLVVPVISKNFSNFVGGEDGTEIDASPIEEAVKQVTDIENKILSICKDGETVFEASPFYCATWYDRAGKFHGVVRVIINSLRTPTLDDVNRLILENS